MITAVTVYGAGYVGLVAAACLADIGHNVTAVDADATRIAALQKGNVPFHEPGLQETVQRGVAVGRLRFTTDGTSAAAGAGVAFLAVGTPPTKNGATDESQLLAAAANAGAGATRDLTLVIKSTAPIGAAERALEAARAASKKAGRTCKFTVVVNPEFLRAGHAVHDFMHPDRIVIGGDDKAALARVVELYEPGFGKEAIITTSLRSAAMIKYAANAMLATRVSFMNELANLAEQVGADIEEIRRGLGSDPRIGSAYLDAGMGFGGSCLPKDAASLLAVARESGVELGVLRATLAANEAQAHRLREKLVRLGGALDDRTIAVWGLAFKEGTDDLRDAPSSILIHDLIEAGASVRAYDPKAGDGARRIYQGTERVTICASADEALTGAFALAITAGWPEFRQVSPTQIAAALSGDLVVDGRNIFDPAEMAAAGLRYSGIGRGLA
jgi:UDPglucose 6-dehydrogenase